MVAWWLLIVVFAIGAAAGWGITAIAVLRGIKRAEAEIDRKNRELDAHIAGGCRQRIVRPEVGPKGGTGTPPRPVLTPDPIPCKGC